MPDCAARTDDPTFGRRYKRHTKKIFRHRTLNRSPGHATIHGMKNRAFITDDPTRFLAREIDRVEHQCRAGRTDGPILTAGTGKQDLAAFAHGPTVRVVDKEDICQIVAAAFSESLP